MRKPFIKLLETPNSKYFYDVNTNTFNCIEEKIFKKLKLENLDNELETMIDEFNSMGLMLEKRVKKLEHPNSLNLQEILNNTMSQMTLQITQQCNLRCEYCPYSNVENKSNRSHSSKKMSWDIAKKSVDFLVQHTYKSERVVIGFYGGEPLLEFELIKKIIKYANASFVGKEILYTITTNGTLLDTSVAEFLYENNVNILISLDGPRRIHDQHRRYANGMGTFEDIYNNLKKMIENKNQDWTSLLSINMVMDPQNEFDEIDVISRESLFKDIQIRSSVYDDSFIDEKVVYSDKYVSQYTYHEFLALLGYLEEIDKDKISSLLLNKIALMDFNRELFKRVYMELPDCGCPSGPCVPGRKKVFVNVDGILYPCEKVSENSVNMKIGTVKDGFDIEKVREMINISRLTEKECKNCWAYRFCKSCIKEIEENGRFSSERRRNECANMLKVVEREMKEYLLVNEYKQEYVGGI